MQSRHVVAQRVPMGSQPGLQPAALGRQAVGPQLVRPGRLDEGHDLGHGAAVVEQGVADVGEQRAQADGLETPADVVDLRALLRDEQHRVPLAGQGGDEVGDRLRRPGPRRGLDDDVLAAEHGLDHPALSRVGIEGHALARGIGVRVEVGFGLMVAIAVGRGGR